jgi:hypothetical protein
MSALEAKTNSPPPIRWGLTPVRSEDRPARLAVWRCPNCGTILAKLALGPGSLVEIKCARCNAFAARSAD